MRKHPSYDLVYKEGSSTLAVSSSTTLNPRSSKTMQVIILAVFIAVAFAADVYPPKAYPTSAYSKEYDYPPQPYSFGWEVNDAPSYNNYAHSESNDGKLTTGSYRVTLPDGRTQIVNYKADSYGYVADVKYEGVAKYPEYKPSAYYPAAPAYNAPLYKAPVY